MINIPPQYSYVETYLTMRCNFSCPYCINGQSEVIRNREELSAKEWAKALNQFNFGDLPLTIGGGEPTLHKGFFELLNLLKKDIKIDLLTNLEFDIDEFISKTSPERFNQRKNPAYRAIRVSYHAENMEPSILIKKIKKLQDNKFSIGLFGISHPENLEANMSMSEIARQNQIYFFVKDFLGYYNNHLFGYFKYPEGLDKTKKEILCKTNDLLIDPSGKVFRCHRDLYKDEGEITRITDTIPEIEQKFRYCSNYGECNPCDIKLKTNRFLQTGQCSIELKGLDTKF